MDVSRLTFRSKFEQILKQLSHFVQNYQKELEHFRVRESSVDENQRDASHAKEGKIEIEPQGELARSLAGVNETLMNIEDDLHKILNLLMMQLELMLERGKVAKQMNIDDSLIEFHEYCQENEIQFTRQLANLKLEMEKSRKLSSSSPKRHYKIKSNDVHFILGTNTGMSHSLVASKQVKLAQLKQHGPLCSQVMIDSNTGLSRRFEKSSSLETEEPTSVAIGSNGISPSEISKQIQTMIEQLQMEHDLIYRLLQKQLKKTDERSRIRTQMLFGHMVHIMNHIHDLHQINTRFLLDR